MIFRILLLVVGTYCMFKIADEEGRRREAAWFLATTGHQVEEEPEKPSAFIRFYRENKSFIRLLCCMLSFMIGIFLSISGIWKMREQTRIEEEGERITAKVIQLEEKKTYLTIRRTEYHYLVEFTVNEMPKQGRTISSQSTLAGKEIDIYYLPEKVSGISNVVIAGRDYRAGTSEQIYGIIGLIIAGVFFWAYKTM